MTIDNLRELEAKATPGEWSSGHQFVFAADRRLGAASVNLVRQLLRGEGELVKRVARALDPEIWADDAPVSTRELTIGFHARRQHSARQARAAISALVSREDRT